MAFEQPAANLTREAQPPSVTRRTILKGAAGVGAALTVAYVAPNVASVGPRPAFGAVSPTPTPTPQIGEVALTELSPTVRALSPGIFTFSAFGDVTADLVFAGPGTAADFAAIDAAGKVALIERSDITFQEKVANAAADGAIGVVIYNRVPGAFTGTLVSTSAIPAVSLPQDEGQLLKAELDSGSTVSVRLQVISA